MSRTTRTLPRWLLSQMKEENQYRNGYRGVRYFGNGLHDMMPFRDDESQTARTERLVMHFSKDGAETSLYHTCRKSVCVGHKVKMQGWAFDVGKNGFRKYVKKHYHKLCRQHNKLVAWNEYVDQTYTDEPEPDDNDYINEGFYVDDDDDFYDPWDGDHNKSDYAKGFNEGYMVGYERAMKHFTFTQRSIA